MTWPELRPEGRLVPSLTLKPYLWMGGNLLFLPPGELEEVLRELARGLPVSVAPPRGRPLSLEALETDLPASGEGEEDLLRQIAACPGLPGPGPRMWLLLLGPRGILNVPEVQGAAALGLPLRVFRAGLEALQDWTDPPGLFARDLQECLLLQLRRRGRDISDEATLLREGRDHLEGGTLERFRREQGWSAERLGAALRELRRLDPAPGRGLVPPEPVRPELSLLPGEGGAVECRLLQENLPRLVCEAPLPEGPEGRRLRDLLLRLGMRARTLVRLGLALGLRQQRHLTDPQAPPAPLNLRTLGEDTGLSPSTVSRCLNQTWARTLRGTLPLGSLLARSPRRRPDLDYPSLEALLREATAQGLTDREVGDRTGLPRRTVAYHRNRLGLRRADPAP